MERRWRWCRKISKFIIVTPASVTWARALGLATTQRHGMSGANPPDVFPMALVAGLLFAVVGPIVYDRTHTLQLDDWRTGRVIRLRA